MRIESRLYVFFAACYLAQGLTGIVHGPLSYVLKDGLGLGPAASAAFIGWMTLPMLVKPVFGLLSDLVPWRGRRRRPWMMLACVVWSASLAALSAAGAPRYVPLLALMLSANSAVVLADVVCDGVMVEQGRLLGKTASFQAVQLAILYLGILATGVGGGWLAAHATTRVVFGLAALPPLLALAAACLIEETPSPGVSAGARSLASLLSSRRFWITSGLIFLWSFAPFLGTAQFFYQSDVLRLSPLEIGWLETAAGLSGAAGAALSARWAGSWPLDARLRACVWLGAPLALGYLAYAGFYSALAVTVLTGAVGVALRLALMEQAARSCPPGAEAVAFAAYMSVFNLAASASNLAGGWLLEALTPRLSPYACLAALTAAGAACTAVCWPLARASGNDAAGA